MGDESQKRQVTSPICSQRRRDVAGSIYRAVPSAAFVAPLYAPDYIPPHTANSVRLHYCSSLGNFEPRQGQNCTEDRFHAAGLGMCLE
jgi:hypothetical protein